MWLYDFEPHDQFQPSLTDTTGLQDTKNFCKFCEKAGSWAEQKGFQIPTSGKTGIVYPLTNLGGNMRTSNQGRNSFLPAVTHAVSLLTTQRKSL